MRKIIEPVFVRTVLIDDSTNIYSLRYDLTNRILDVEFTNRRRYRYHNCSPVMFGTLAAAESVGEAFALIKDQLGGYEEIK